MPNQSRILILFAFVLFFLAPPAQASGETHFKCESKKFSGRTVSWCHEWDEGITSKQVIYYFHGIGGTEKSWQDSSIRQALRLEAITLGKSMPHVITISFGPAWFLTDVRKARDSSRLDTFFKNFLPAVEAKLKEKPEKRFLIGESMGGFNAIRADMAQPAMFEKLAALCPALLPISPYSTSEEKEVFAARNPHMDVEMMRGLKGWAQQEFPSLPDWIKNSPIERMNSKEQKALSTSFFSANKEDQYGFQEGSIAFAKEINEKFGQSRFRLLDGTHCQHTPELLSEVADFILKP
jgi:pimeloyl-ACP methyl ester carboxylesterase